MTKAATKTIEHDPEKPRTVAVSRAPSTTPLDMLNRAIELGNIEMVERFMELYERWRAAEAKRAYDNALADAKAEFPKIKKTKHVKFDNKGGGKTDYKHEGLDDIDVITPIMSKYGLTWRHRSTQEGDRLTVTCVISHRDGYSEENSLGAGSDKTGGKNDIQAMASTATLLSRYTLKLALGLAPTLAGDDDGKAAGGALNPMSADHVAEIKRLCNATATAHELFAQHMLPNSESPSIEDIPDRLFQAAQRKLLAKKAKMPVNQGEENA